MKGLYSLYGLTKDGWQFVSFYKSALKAQEGAIELGKRPDVLGARVDLCIRSWGMTKF